MARKLQVLCLHGFNSNGAVFRRRTRAWAEACSQVAVFHYLDAPHLVPLFRPLQGVDDYATEAELGVPDDPPAAAASDADAQAAEEHLMAQASAQMRVSPERRARGWWRLRDHDDGLALWGWAQTVQYLNQQLAQLGPLDAIIGFSQGAALSLLLSAAFEQRASVEPAHREERQCSRTAAPSVVPKLSPHPDQAPLKVCIAVSGFRTRDLSQQALFHQPLRTPVLSINGAKDPVVTPRKSARARDAFTHWREVLHKGGHTVPVAEPWPTLIQDTLVNAEYNAPNWAELPDGVLTQAPTDKHRM